MIGLKTFTLGGVHPEENKLSANKPIEVLPVPKMAYILVGQNLGAPSKALVKRGDKVKVGQLIAKGEAFISSNVHSSVSGTVKKVDTILDTSGYKKLSIQISVEGDEWEEGIDRTDTIVRDIKLDKHQIIEALKEKGIVGLGGATFPSHVKLMIPEGKKVEYLIINGVECEPYLTADHRLMLEHGEELLIGIEILKKGLDAKKAIIGIENNKKDAVAHLTKLAEKFEGTTIQPLKVKYPQGGEKQLIKALINREVPSGKLPIEVGCVVNNVGTAFAVYEVVQKNKPLIDRIVTVTGKSLANPCNLRTRIGTPIKELIDHAGALPEDTGKVVNGGPMMGKALVNIDVPVVKGTSGILIFSEEESKRVEVQPCIRCAKCVDVCPMGLLPLTIAKYGENKLWEKAEKELVMDCIECGSCHYTCPSGRPLLDHIRIAKSSVGQLIRSRRRK